MRPYNTGLNGRFGFRVTPAYRDNIETLARLEDVSLSRIIRKALIEYAEKRSKRGRRLADFTDKALENCTEEDRQWKDLIRENKRGYAMIHLYRQLADSLVVEE